MGKITIIPLIVAGSVMFLMYAIYKVLFLLFLLGKQASALRRLAYVRVLRVEEVKNHE